MEALRARMAEVGEQNAGDPEIQVGQISLLQRDAETCAIAAHIRAAATYGPNLILSVSNNILDQDQFGPWMCLGLCVCAKASGSRLCPALLCPTISS